MSDEVELHFDPEKKHEHHHSRPKRSVVKPIVYGFMSFMLAFVLFLLTVCMVIRLTLFSSDFMIGSMASCGYYSMVKDELKDGLTALGHASGLPDSFCAEFVETIDFRQVEMNYIVSFYSGSSTLVDDTSFKQSFRAAIDKYIEDNNIDKSKTTESSLVNLVNKATDIYIDNVSIPFFSILANYIYKLSGTLNVIMMVLVVIAVIIGLLIYFTNEYKHRRHRYLCYAFITSAITAAIIPTIVYVSGIVAKVNLGTRSIYNLFVTYFSSMFRYFYYFAGIYLFLAIITFVFFRIAYGKTAKHH